MKVIEVDNVNQAVAQALPYLLSEGIREKSRNGDVLVAPGPVMTIYKKPTQRVLFSKTRDANPVFHLMESLWMLAGRNDLKWPVYFNSRFASYSDDGVHCHGAYGYRWRLWFGMDQIQTIAEELRTNPNSRRAVMAMWSPAGDLCAIGAQNDKGEIVEQVGGLRCKDVPCNTHAYFDTRNGALNMTVCNRSNDAIWGAYGANAVHFAVMMEYMAAYIGCKVGVYRQFSNNFHAYTDIYNEEKLEQIAQEAAATNYYEEQEGTLFDGGKKALRPHPLVSVRDIEKWNNDLRQFNEDPLGLRTYSDPFFNTVAAPMYLAWAQRKEKKGDGLAQIEAIAAEDWKHACVQWAAKRTKGN